MPRSLVQPIDGEAGYEQALEWRERFQQVLDSPDQYAEGTAPDAIEGILDNYRQHIEALSRGIEEYEQAQRGQKKRAVHHMPDVQTEAVAYLTDGQAEAVAYLHNRISRIETTIWGLACQVAAERSLAQPGLREVEEAWNTWLGTRPRNDRGS